MPQPQHADIRLIRTRRGPEAVPTRALVIDRSAPRVEHSRRHEWWLRDSRIVGTIQMSSLAATEATFPFDGRERDRISKPSAHLTAPSSSALANRRWKCCATQKREWKRHENWSTTFHRGVPG